MKPQHGDLEVGDDSNRLLPLTPGITPTLRDNSDTQLLDNSDINPQPLGKSAFAEVMQS